VAPGSNPCQPGAGLKPPANLGWRGEPFWTRCVAAGHVCQRAHENYQSGSTSTTVRDEIPEKSSTFRVKTGSSLATAVAAMSAS